MALWLETLARHVPVDEIKVVLDVGCGTGRFSASLSERFGATVVGVDPSWKMLVEARRTVHHPRVEFLQAKGERLPLEGSCGCLVYLSMVYHHMENMELAAAEFFRVLRSGGFLCIRNSTLDLLSSVPYLRFFPSAFEFNERRLPSQRDVMDAMQKQRFILLVHEVIHQRFARNLREYYDKIRERGLSDLASLPDREFEEGIERMRKAVEQEVCSGPILEPINLFVFKKKAEPACAPRHGKTRA